ncbi:DUF4846 domain-containing protein [Thermodesulfobacteriota bacterium]
MPERTIASEIDVPEGFQRIEVEDGSFAEWLRNLPLKKEGSPVILHNGKRKRRQDVHAAVIDIDRGTRNLQQCADAVIRLRAEYLFSKKCFLQIHFNFTSGHEAKFTQWVSGFRPVVNGSNVRWVKKTHEDASYKNFRKYLRTVFMYAGSYSLSKELKRRQDVKDIQIGDVFIQGGFPGHAVIVVDMAQHLDTGEKIFLVAQSYMPAQDTHILKNPDDQNLSPWYRVPHGNRFKTPEWTFQKTDLKYFRTDECG